MQTDGPDGRPQRNLSQVISLKWWPYLAHCRLGSKLIGSNPTSLVQLARNRFGLRSAKTSAGVFWGICRMKHDGVPVISGINLGGLDPIRLNPILQRIGTRTVAGRH